MDKYANIKTIFLSEALVNAILTSDLEYKHELKSAVNNLKRVYNQKVTKDMLKMYENHEEAFDLISDYTERIGKEFSKTDPTKYAQLLELFEKFNRDELFKNQTDE